MVVVRLMGDNVYEWIARDFTPEESHEWAMADFGPEDAAEWHSSGYTAKKARHARAAETIPNVDD